MEIKYINEYLKAHWENVNEKSKDSDIYVEWNKKLVERYPFLLPRNRWTDEVLENYGYEWTELDAMPEGWRIAFASEMLEELREELIKFDYLYKYRIVQLKEKFGELRIYDNGVPKGCRVWDIIDKYTHLSTKVCIYCGKPAQWITKGWIYFLCDDCAVDTTLEHRTKIKS